ncbi:MAG: tetratricopeptide repeat protein, partial [Nitrososphaera sp.]|nr:tetratricopeptide repeat protein [Nitrososphaera sp.]
KLADIPMVQEEISREISEKLQLRLTGAEKKRLTKRYTENTAAYQLYLKGRHFWNKGGSENLKRAIDYFEQALEHDPAYALAYAGLADCYVSGAYTKIPPRDVLPKAKAAAKKALEIDDTLAEAHTALAGVNMHYDWDWLESERELKRAIELNPNYATAYQWYAYHLAALGRFDEALAKIKRAQELDPLSSFINATAGFILYLAHRYDQAIDHHRKLAEMEPEPNLAIAHFRQGQSYEQQGLNEKAIAEFLKAADLFKESSDVIAKYKKAYAESGMRGYWQIYWQIKLDLAKEQSKQSYVSAYDIARFYAHLGEKEQAFAWLKKAYEERSYALVYLNVAPGFDSLHLDPRFAALLKKIGLRP